jgi:hypothetical protein
MSLPSHDGAYFNCMNYSGLTIAERSVFVISGDYDESRFVTIQTVVKMTVALYTVSAATNAIATGLVIFKTW